MLTVLKCFQRFHDLSSTFCLLRRTVAKTQNLNFDSTKPTVAHVAARRMITDSADHWKYF